jgi:hypothetical protein
MAIPLPFRRKDLIQPAACFSIRRRWPSTP